MTDKLQAGPQIRLCSRRDRNDRRGFHTQFHAHPFFELAWVESGSCLWTVEPRRTFPLSTGQCLLLPPNTRHREDMEGDPGGRVSWIGFEMPGAEKMLQSLSFKRIDLHELMAETLVLHRCVEREWNGSLADARTMAGYALEMLLVHLRRRVIRRRHVRPRREADLNERQMRIVLAATSYFEQNPSLPRSVEQVARIQSLSVSHFSALFRKWHGVGPRDYVQQMRVRRARDLLQTTDLSIKEIAVGNGYVDSAHFCRHFRRETGQTPSECRLEVGKPRGRRM